MNPEEFIRRMRKGIPIDRVLKSSDEFRELCLSLEARGRQEHHKDRIIEALTDVVEDQHQIILGYMEAEKQRGLDSGKVYAEHSKGARK